MRIKFNGIEYRKNNRSGYALNNLCFEIFKEYLKQNKNNSIDEIQNLFNRQHCWGKDVVLTYDEWNHKTDDRKSRYFPPVEYAGEKLYFTTQWGNNGVQQGKNCDNINKIIDFAKEQGYKIEVLEEHQEKVENHEDAFRKWWFENHTKKSNGELYAETTKSSYFRELQRLKDVLGYSIFEVDDLQELNKILDRLLNGDLKEYNTRLQNMDPSSGLRQYIKFIQLKSKPTPSEKQISNIILYGPPGVGKTHNINKLITLIEAGESTQEIFQGIEQNEKSEYISLDEVKERVKFVTFHQSFGYEDFIEGFRPNEEGKIELEDGVFKRLALQAQANLEKATQSKSFDIERFLNAFAEYVEEQDSYEIEDKLVIEVNRNSNGDFRSFTTSGRVKGQSLTKEIIKRDFEKFLSGEIGTYQQIKPKFESQSIYHGNAPYYFKLFVKMREFLDVNQEKFRVEKEELKNYYLIIDEINRGNISKIFGELITLIEEDKRDKLEVTLPYSKERFKVPSNLYIIGTMNSTDKSIALIDIALRRRFTFLKMEPNAELIDDPRAKEIFVSLNAYISEKLGEEYQIGHSYFMGEDIDLDFVLEYKIKPLLEEYFYGDMQGLEEAERIISERLNTVTI